jgi:hypothetical protein
MGGATDRMFAGPAVKQFNDVQIRKEVLTSSGH